MQRTSQKSPISTAAGLLSIEATVGMPRRSVAPSTTSSCRRVALCISSAAAAKRMESSLTWPQACPTRRASTGRIIFPPFSRKERLVPSSREISLLRDALICVSTRSSCGFR